jgi:hypothetical protein
MDQSRLVVGAQRQDALGVLAGPEPVLGALDAVVDRVADEVRERVLDRVQQGKARSGRAG